MNNTALKLQIDTEITNKTVAKSITKLNVADNMKDIVDYVDQQDDLSVKVKKVQLTSSEILNIFTTPKELIAGISGKIIQPLNIVFKYNFNTIAYSGGNWKVNINNNLFTVASTINTNHDTIQSQLVINTYNDDAINIISNSLKLSMNSNPTLGDGTVDVYVTYIEITL